MGKPLKKMRLFFLFSLIFLRFHLLRDMRFHHECDHLPEGWAPAGEAKKSWPFSATIYGATRNLTWLVVTGTWILCSMKSWEFHHHWRIPSFFRGVGWNHQPVHHSQPRKKTLLTTIKPLKWFFRSTEICCRFCRKDRCRANLQRRWNRTTAMGSDDRHPQCGDESSSQDMIQSDVDPVVIRWCPSSESRSVGG